MVIGGFLKDCIPDNYKIDVEEASANSFTPNKILSKINQQRKSLCESG
jgi:hypothetical protein